MMWGTWGAGMRRILGLALCAAALAAPATLPIPMLPAAGTLPATITVVTNLVSYDVFGAAASGITVQVFAIPTTQ